MAIRREIRLRKEFLLKKQLEAVATLKNDKKRKLKSAIDEGKRIPTEIQAESRGLHHELEMDINPLNPDADGDDVKWYDDEYGNVGVHDPKVCVTTSRDPSSRLKQFAKEIKLCVPNSQVINRGTHRVDELVDACKKADFTDIIVINETRGQPDGLTVSHLPFGPTAYFTLSNCVLRHDIPECTAASQAYPHLILDNLSSKVGRRVGRILQALYPVPKPESRRLITFANRDDFLSFRHHMYTKDKGKVVISEAGPRFEMQPYEIRLGTLDQELAEKEWVLRPYMNTSRKSKAL